MSLIDNIFYLDSGLVRLWVRLIEKGVYVAEQVPRISNLRTMVIVQIESEE